MSTPTCIHCGKLGVIIVPIDDDEPGDSDVEICAWSCTDCVHKRVTFRDGPVTLIDGEADGAPSV